MLLHNAIAVQVEAEHDPVAVLLILCDEVFEWDPTAQLAPTETGRNLQRIGTAMEPHILRDRSIRMRDVRMKDDGSETYLTLPRAGNEPWPVLDLTLAEPEQLDQPVFVLWLRKSRNLGRIRRATWGFGPTIVMRSGVSCLLKRLGLTNLSLLEEIAGRISPDSQDLLHDWLLEVTTSMNPALTETDEEVVTLGPLSTSRIFEGEFRKLRSELEQKATELIRERRISAQPSGGPRTADQLPPPLPDPASVRARLSHLLRTDSDFTAFCLDRFPSVQRRFADGMERVAKCNLLLQLVDPVRVSAELDAWQAMQEKDSPA